MYTFQNLNQNLIKLFTIFILLFLISFLNISGCGSGSDSNIIGPDGGTVTSKDGRLTLIFPPGAVDEDVEILIDEIDPSNLPPEFEGTETERQYNLQPDGLEFNIPIEIEYLSDQQALNQQGNLDVDNILLFTSLNGELEVLGNLETIINGDDNTVIARGTLGHFSPIVITSIFVTVEINNVPGTIEINTPFTIDVQVQQGSTLVVSFLTASYTDNSIANIFPISDLINVSLSNLSSNPFDYVCSSSNETLGTLRANIDVTATLSETFVSSEAPLFH